MQRAPRSQLACIPGDLDAGSLIRDDRRHCASRDEQTLHSSSQSNCARGGIHRVACVQPPSAIADSDGFSWIHQQRHGTAGHVCRLKLQRKSVYRGRLLRHPGFGTQGMRSMDTGHKRRRSVSSARRLQGGDRARCRSDTVASLAHLSSRQQWGLEFQHCVLGACHRAGIPDAISKL
jgi:hypothetical protein